MEGLNDWAKGSRKVQFTHVFEEKIAFFGAEQSLVDGDSFAIFNVNILTCEMIKAITYIIASLSAFISFEMRASLSECSAFNTLVCIVSKNKYSTYYF